MGCGWYFIGGSFATIILCIAIAVVIVAHFVNKFYQNYQTSIVVQCSHDDYYSYGKFPNKIKVDKYQENLAQQLVRICLNVTMSNCPGSNPPPPPPGFKITDTIKGTDPSNEKQDLVWAYIFSSSDLTILCFTGTFFLSQWMDDLQTSQIAPTEITGYESGMEVEKGFWQIYQQIISKIEDALSSATTPIIITGHSLGGALTTLASFDLSSLSPLVYTFASPRVGNNIFANIYDTTLVQYRVFDTEDIIPDLPPAVGIKSDYTHVGTPIPFTLNLGSFTSNHDEAYIEGV